MNGWTLARYLSREALRACVMTLAVLVAITLALFLGELLGDIAEGQVLASTLGKLLLLRVPEALTLTAPLALAVGVLMSLGELAQNEELTVVRASGLGPAKVLRIVLAVGVAWAAGVAAIAGWVSPWSEQQTSELAERMADELLVARIRPGQFQTLAGGRLSVYVREADLATGRLNGVFVHYTEDERIETVVARSGRLSIHPETGRRVLSLRHGMHLGHAETPAGLPLRRIEFDRNDIELPVATQPRSRDPMKSRSPVELVRDDSAAAGLELQRRLMPAVISLVLPLFALPITLSGARGSRFGVVLVVIVIYLVYSNVGNLLLVRAGAGSWPGIWPLHAAALALAAVPVAWWWRRW